MIVEIILPQPIKSQYRKKLVSSQLALKNWIDKSFGNERKARTCSWGAIFMMLSSITKFLVWNEIELLEEHMNKENSRCAKGIWRPSEYLPFQRLERQPLEGILHCHCHVPLTQCPLSSSRTLRCNALWCKSEECNEKQPTELQHGTTWTEISRWCFWLPLTQCPFTWRLYIAMQCTSMHCDATQKNPVKSNCFTMRCHVVTWHEILVASFDDQYATRNYIKMQWTLHVEIVQLGWY